MALNQDVQEELRSHILENCTENISYGKLGQIPYLDMVIKGLKIIHFQFILSYYQDFYVLNKYQF